VEQSEIDQIVNVVRLASITRVDAYKRTSTLGNTVRVNSYLRKVFDAIDSLGGPKVAAKRGINVDALKKEAQKADKGQSSPADFESRLRAAVAPNPRLENIGRVRSTPADARVKLNNLAAMESAVNGRQKKSVSDEAANARIIAEARPFQTAEDAYKQTVANGGVTINLGGNRPTKGIAYAPFKDTEQIVPGGELTPEVIQNYMRTHADKLKDPNNHLGLWEDDGKVYLDISTVGPKNADTLQKAQDADQLGAFDLENFETVPLGKIDENGYTPHHAKATDHPYLNGGKDAGAGDSGTDGERRALPDGAGAAPDPVKPAGGQDGAAQDGQPDLNDLPGERPIDDAGQGSGPAASHSEALVGLKDISQEGRPSPPAKGTSDDPINVGSDLDQAVQLLAQGKHVRLNQPDEVSVLMDKVNDWVQQVKAQTGKEPVINLCSVTVKGTNLFCAESKGVPRAQMPQLGGVPLPNSPAAQKVNAKGKADISDDFRQALTDLGVKVEDSTVPASHLRATQSELGGSAVAAMAEAMREGKIKDERIFVSRDNYVIDGHHRWASKLVVDSDDGDIGDVTMQVSKVDLDIGAVLDFANEFATKMGIPPRALGVKSDAPATPNTPDGKDAPDPTAKPTFANTPGLPAIKSLGRTGDGADLKQVFEGGQPLPVGTTRVWQGVKFEKQRNGEWNRVKVAKSKSVKSPGRKVPSDVNKVAASNTTPTGRPMVPACCAPTEEDRSPEHILQLAAALTEATRRVRAQAQPSSVSPLDRLDLKVTRDNLVELSIIERVDSYRRRSTTGNSVHVDSYLRKRLDLFGAGVGDKTKRGAFVDRYNQIKAERGQGAAERFARHDAEVAAGDVGQPEVAADIKINRSIAVDPYAPTFKPTYDEPVQSGNGWAMKDHPFKKGVKVLAMSPDVYHEHRIAVKKILKASAGQATDRTHADHIPLFNDDGSPKLNKKGKQEVEIRWHDERVRLHKAIVRDIINRADRPGSGVGHDHQAVMSGGLGGAGKSTILGKKESGIDASNYVIANPDDMKDELIRRNAAPQVPGLQPIEAATLLHEESSHLAKLVASAAQDRDLNVMWDITMASDSSVKERLDELDRNGYNTRALFVDIPIETSVQRALGRHQEGVEDFRARNQGLGGRYVDPDHIRANEPSEGSPHNSQNREVFERLKDRFYDWQIWDTSAADFNQAKRVDEVKPGTIHTWADGKRYVKGTDGNWTPVKG
jgi:hypothetical protein